MKKLIKVQPAITPIEYGSFFSATKDVADLTSKLDAINGRVLKSYKFDICRLILVFDNDACLDIQAKKDLLAWNISYCKEFLDDTEWSDDICFEYPDGTRAEWNLKSILDHFVGRKVVVSPSEQFLFMYTSDRIEYMINSVFERDNPDKIYICISEA